MKAWLLKLGAFFTSAAVQNFQEHFWFTAGLVFVATLFFPTLWWLWPIAAIVYAAAKEFGFDHNFETPPEPFANGLTTFIYLSAGGMLPILCIWIKRAFS
jgi:hypothetical protein